jgi:hypothetical protein
MEVNLNPQDQPTSLVGNAKWTLEEYKLLTAHYFHEDNFYHKVTTTFATLNAGLLAFTRAAPSNIIVSNRTVSLVGMALCVCWFSSLVRIREYRRAAENRIQRIEVFWSTLPWQNAELVPDIRRMTHWHSIKPKYTWWNWWLIGPYRLFRLLPTSLVMLVLPVAFIIAWILVLR